jgi:uncharacterized protein
MELTILAASGATGLELTRQALARGHTVTAVARTPARITVPDSPLLTRVAADVRDPASIAAALHGSRVVLSGLGIVGGETGVLTAGARAAVAARPERIIWLGAFGTGASARVAGATTRTLLKLVLGKEIPDKVAADTLVLEAGGTVFHAGPLSTGPLSADRRTLALSDAPKSLLPARVSRATVAAAMLAEAETRAHPGGVALPLER